MNIERLTSLAQGFVNGTATEEEQTELHRWYDDWEDSEETVLGIDDEEIHVKNRIKNAIEAHINNTIVEDEGRVKHVWWRWIAAAVFLSVSVTLLWKWSNDNRPIAEKTNVVASAVQVRERVNATDTTVTVLLQDGSVVELGAKSSLKYNEPFDWQGKRMVYLEGQALFKVAKDKTKPFTVVSRELSTTALGTAFTVKALKNSDFVRVLLHHGRVVVKPADSLKNSLLKDYYLSPGEELVYNRTNKVVRIYTVGGVKDSKGNADVAGTDGVIKKPEWYKFDGVLLSDVLDQLEVYYQVQIDYSPSDVQNMYFTGRVDKNDSLQNILRDIGLLNDLTITKQNDSYFVIKKK